MLWKILRWVVGEIGGAGVAGKQGGLGCGESRGPGQARVKCVRGWSGALAVGGRGDALGNLGGGCDYSLRGHNNQEFFVFCRTEVAVNAVQSNGRDWSAFNILKYAASWARPEHKNLLHCCP